MPPLPGDAVSEDRSLFLGALVVRPKSPDPWSRTTHTHTLHPRPVAIPSALPGRMLAQPQHRSDPAPLPTRRRSGAARRRAWMGFCATSRKESRSISPHHPWASGLVQPDELALWRACHCKPASALMIGGLSGEPDGGANRASLGRRSAPLEHPMHCEDRMPGSEVATSSARNAFRLHHNLRHQWSNRVRGQRASTTGRHRTYADANPQRKCEAMRARDCA